MSRAPYLLDPAPGAPFPDPSHALGEPDGLLAIGGDLSPTRLLAAYRAGIFPWFSPGQPILWWSPDPRLVFRTDRVRLARRFRRSMRASDWSVTADGDFPAVVAACAAMPRPGQRGTWITPGMRSAYEALHREGHAHSIEVRDAGGRLVGGLYGVAVGRMFFGESMVSLESGGSKVALAALARQLDAWGWPLLDAQVANPHLLGLGAEPWPRSRFLDAVARLASEPSVPGDWQQAFGTVRAAVLSDRPPA